VRSFSSVATASWRRSRRASGSLLVLSLLGGCQIIGGGAPGGAGEDAWGFQPPEGVVYQGFLEMDGGRVPAALELVREGGRRVRGALQAGSGIRADGEGSLRGTTLSIDLTYGGDCPGRMSLEGEWNQEEETYEGVVEASDCTGRSSGTFRFSAS
jgi:hypothetical protein